MTTSRSLPFLPLKINTAHTCCRHVCLCHVKISSLSKEHKIYVFLNGGIMHKQRRYQLDHYMGSVFTSSLCRTLFLVILLMLLMLYIYQQSKFLNSISTFLNSIFYRGREDKRDQDMHSHLWFRICDQVSHC